MKRRDFLKYSAAAGLITAAPYALTQKTNTEALEITRIPVSSKKISPSFDGYKIAFISDLHCGVFLSEYFLSKVVESVNKESPDLIILGGDYIGIPDNLVAKTCSYLTSSRFVFTKTYKMVSDIFVNLSKELLKLNPKDGIYAVMGNHDHWNNGDICVNILSDNGVRFLINQETRIKKGQEEIILYGSDDYWTSIPSVSNDFLNLNHNSFKIFISHNPDFIAETVYFKKTCFDLALAGHTHGGQICLRGLGPIAGYNIRYSEFGRGTVSYENSIIHTSRGIGVVDIPLRINSTPEISLIILKSA